MNVIVYAVTLIAALFAFSVRPGPVSRVLLVAWCMSAVIGLLGEAGLAGRSYMPGMAVAIDMMIAMTCLSIATRGASGHVRAIGLISMLLIFLHFGYAASHGEGPWHLYALVGNALFVVQCIVAGGGLYGMADFHDRLWRRDSRVRHHRGVR